MAHFVYILASRRYGTLYIGAAEDLVRRDFTHRQELVAGFSRRYGVHRLVYFECHDRAADALQRERTLKHWK